MSDVVKCFFCIYCNNHMGFPFWFVNMLNCMIDFLMPSQSCIPGIKSILLWFIILVIHYWIWFDKVFFRIFVSLELSILILMAPQIGLPTMHLFSRCPILPVHILYTVSGMVTEVVTEGGTFPKLTEGRRKFRTKTWKHFLYVVNPTSEYVNQLQAAVLPLNKGVSPTWRAIFKASQYLTG